MLGRWRASGQRILARFSERGGKRRERERERGGRWGEGGGGRKGVGVC